MQKLIDAYRRAIVENYANFSGRDNRPDFWWFVLANFSLSILISIVATAISVPVIGTVYSLAVLVPGVAAAVRRLHHTDRTGWWLLLLLIPIIGAVVVIVFLATPGHTTSNRYGTATMDIAGDPGYPPMGGTPPPPPPPPSGDMPPPPPPT